jgi:peptidoglycan/xylan/chitin deacetylase (PgdA/CDA1 family)
MSRTLATNRLALKENYLVREGIVIEAFTTIGDWTPSPASPGSLDVVNDSEHGTCLSITSATSANNKQAIKTINRKFTEDVFTFFVKPDNNTDTIVIGFSSQTTFATVYMNYSLSSTNLQKNKWNLVRVAKADFIATGGEVWTNTMIRMRFRNVSNSATLPSTALFSDLRIQRVYKAKILLQSDNVGSLSTIEKMYPILNTAGLKGTVFVESGLIGVAGKLTLANLQTLYSAGWDLGNHTVDHADLTAISIDEAEANVLSCGGFLSSNGFTRGAEHIAFPLGATNDTVSAMLEINGFNTGRKATDRTQTVPVADMFKLDAYTIKAADSLATVKGYVDTAITKGSTSILMIEGLADSSPSAQEWLTSDYQALIDYILLKKRQGLLDVVTVSEWYNGLSV